MGFTRREFLALAGAGTLAGIAGCSKPAQDQPAADSNSGSQTTQVDLEEFRDLALDEGAWRYDEDNDVYYQLGLAYCKKPATKTYESLAVFVPGKYFSAEKNGDTYRCTVDEKAVVGGYTPSTAPVLMPVNTGTLSPQTSPTAYSYDGLAPFMEAGCIYVYAGFRGRSAGYDTASGKNELYPGGSPWPVVDLKAAVRYLRYNAGSLPCDASRVFVFGFAAGGGVSAVLGSSGDSALYTPYLESIGAATHDAKGASISDAVFGSASWCPVTSFDEADAAYEWAMGQYASEDTRAEGTWTRQLSQDLAASYGEYVNEMDLRADDDSQLTLDVTDSDAYSMGSYADAVASVIDDSATWFVQNTPFPYAYTPQRLTEPSFPGDPNLAATRASEAAQTQVTTDAAASSSASTPDTGATATGEAQAQQTSTVATPADSALPSGLTQVQSTIYDSAQSYFAALNEDYVWINYNRSRQSVSVSNLRSFSLHLRQAERPVSPYDLPDRSSRINQLFGIGEESTLHFDAVVAGLVKAKSDAYAALTGWDPSYETAWADDLEKKDSLDTDMATRVATMNPLYWLSGHYEGYGQAGVAAHWRINEGLFDTDASPCTALNMALALRKYDGVKDVAYTPVWGQGHVLAERSGSAVSNLVQWVNACCLG